MKTRLESLVGLSAVEEMRCCNNGRNICNIYCHIDFELDPDDEKLLEEMGYRVNPHDGIYMWTLVLVRDLDYFMNDVGP